MSYLQTRHFSTKSKPKFRGTYLQLLFLSTLPSLFTCYSYQKYEWAKLGKLLKK